MFSLQEKDGIEYLFYWQKEKKPKLVYIFNQMTRP